MRRLSGGGGFSGIEKKKTILMVQILAFRDLFIYIPGIYFFLAEQTTEDYGTGYNLAQRTLWPCLRKTSVCFALTLLCFLSFNGQTGLVGYLLEYNSWILPTKLSWPGYLFHSIALDVL